MTQIKSLFSSDVDVTFGYDTFHVDERGFADVSDATKAHILTSQPGLWADPETQPIQAQMSPAERTQRRVPSPDVVRRNTPGVVADEPATPVFESAELRGDVAATEGGK